jgi:hypothetical protein
LISGFGGLEDAPLIQMTCPAALLMYSYQLIVGDVSDDAQASSMSLPAYAAKFCGVVANCA